MLKHLAKKTNCCTIITNYLSPYLPSCTSLCTVHSQTNRAFRSSRDPLKATGLLSDTQSSTNLPISIPSRHWRAASLPCLLKRIPNTNSDTCNIELRTSHIHVCGVYGSLKLDKKLFHTSPKHEVPPLVWLVIRPLAQIGAIISGRFVRKWWQNLPEHQRAQWRKHLHLTHGRIALALALLIGFALLDYFTHIQETPLTGRKRFIAFTPEQFQKIMKYEFDSLWDNVSENIVSPDHPAYKRICRVAEKIVHSNQDLEFFQQQTWTVLVVDSPSENAFVLPTGHIFVYTGLLETMQNDDQLAVVLGHEMAHALLSHGAEQVSFAQMLDVLIILVMAGIWAIMPNDGIALVTQWFYRKVMQILLHLPYNRKLEREADEVGLQLMAKACYDVRESSTFWNMMTIRSEVKGDEEVVPEWLSTHPANDVRAQILEDLIPKAIELRNSCKCPPLVKGDPRLQVKMLQEMVKTALEEKQKQSDNSCVIQVASPSTAGAAVTS